MPKGVYPRDTSKKDTLYSEVFYGIIQDVKSHSSSNDKLVKQIDFAIEQSDEIDPITNRPWIVNRSSFVREVLDVNFKSLSEVNLLALRGHRVEVRVHNDYWVIELVD